MSDRSVQGQNFGKRPKPPHHLILSQGTGIRRITLPRWSLLATCAAFGLMSVWSLGATGFILFRDDFVAGIVSREASIQYGYEGRIATLKAELAKLQSRQLIDQQAFAEKVDTLVRRQVSLESRQAILQSLADMATAVGIRPTTPQTLDEPATTPATPQPLPDTDSGALPVKPGKQAQIRLLPPLLADTTGALALAEPAARRRSGADVSGKLDAVAGSLDAVETRQAETLAEIGTHAKERVGHIRDALEDIGLDADKLATRDARPPAEGGPFIPLELPQNATPFETLAFNVQEALATADGLDRLLTNVPLKRPFPKAQITSTFGARTDPFLGTMAMHAGIDFSEESGAPVRATASGVVDEAGWAGGYGNMVEIAHGNGLATRYGHMSEILVSPGEKVVIGQIIGRVGSTGRSTGPHLHYETRINGQAVDPMRFLRAGREIEKS